LFGAARGAAGDLEDTGAEFAKGTGNMDPARLRLVGPIHIAETRKKACVVVPSGRNAPQIPSYDWCTEHCDEFSEKRSAAARSRGVVRTALH
jgi:hypothetical protein